MVSNACVGRQYEYRFVLRKAVTAPLKKYCSGENSITYYIVHFVCLIFIINCFLYIYKQFTKLCLTFNSFRHTVQSC